MNKNTYNVPGTTRLKSGATVRTYTTQTENAMIVSNAPVGGVAKLIQCEQCVFVFPTWSTSEKDLIRMAKRAGWQLEEQILCPACKSGATKGIEA